MTGFATTTRWLTEDYEPDPFHRRPVTCSVCGCRLAPVPDSDGTAWAHFEGAPGQDARGCRPSCVDALHGRDGRVGPMAPLEVLLADGGSAA